MPGVACRGERFGHDFPYPGARCTRCGIGQGELSGSAPSKVGSSLSPLKVIEAMSKLGRRSGERIHSPMHLLVDDIRRSFGETARRGKGSFGFYLGMLGRIGYQEAYALWRSVENGECRDKKRVFWWAYKNRFVKGAVDNSASQNDYGNVH